MVMGRNTTLILLDEDGSEIAVHRLPYGTHLRVDDGVKVKRGDRLAEWGPYTRPVLTEIEGAVDFEDLVEGVSVSERRDESTGITNSADDGQEPVEYLIPKGRHLSVQEGDRIEKGEFLLDGHPAPHDILAIKGVEELAHYLVNEIQEVYRLQGVTINDKHIEVIVRQMLQKIEIEDPGSTDLLKGEQIDRLDLDDANEAAVAAGGKPASGQPVLLGITKASLQTRSFISAASFQETTRVLTDAAVNGKVDALEGLKENVIVGRLIPAGTGGTLTRLNKIATHRDELILEERKRAAAERLAKDDEEAAEEEAST